MRTDRATFETNLEDALAAVPVRLRARMRNVAIVLEETSDRASRHSGEAYEGVGVKKGHQLLGLYEGVGWLGGIGTAPSALPDKITVFMDVIERVAEQQGQDVAVVTRQTLWHELAHYFGFDEQEARALQTKWEGRYRALMEKRSGGTAG